MSKIDISIGKRWPNSRVPLNKRGSRGGRPHLTLYFRDEDGKFRTKPINKVQELLKKPHILKRRTFYCVICLCKFIGFTKDGITSLSECPNGCDSDMS